MFTTVFGKQHLLWGWLVDGVVVVGVVVVDVITILIPQENVFVPLFLHVHFISRSFARWMLNAKFTMFVRTFMAKPIRLPF